MAEQRKAGMSGDLWSAPPVGAPSVSEGSLSQALEPGRTQGCRWGLAWRSDGSTVTVLGSLDQRFTWNVDPGAHIAAAPQVVGGMASAH